jgi:hypothetical protein
LRVAHSKIIPAVMEERMKDISQWEGLLSSEIGGLLFVDMSSDDDSVFVDKCEELYRRIAGILNFAAPSSLFFLQ